jgi:transcriptional regulator NrdR family protein
MAKEVIKRDGSRQPFDAEKIKNAIRAAGAETDVADEEIEKAVEQVMVSVLQVAGEKEVISTAEIKEKVLSELDTIKPAISEAWRKYDREKKEVS